MKYGWIALLSCAYMHDTAVLPRGPGKVYIINSIIQ